MLRTLPKTTRQGKKKNPKPGQAMNESVASSWADAVKATLTALGALAALIAPTQPLARSLPPGRKRRVLGKVGCRWRSR